MDRLKIDRSFVSQLGGSDGCNTIAQMIVQLGHSMGLTVVAEGVETGDQAAVLRRLACNEAQGYLYSPALSPSAFAAWVRERAGAA